MDWRDKLGALLPDDYKLETESVSTDSVEEKQFLRIELDRRKGKPATLITGFKGSEEELKELAKTLKNRCATGGSQRGGEILLQGDFRQKTADILETMGHRIRRINF